MIDRLRAAGCVFAEDEARLILATARTPDELAAMVRRRVGGLPLEQVVGWAEFCGRRVSLDPGVFVPRRRTEFLVRQAISHVTTRVTGHAADHPTARPTARAGHPAARPTAHADRAARADHAAHADCAAHADHDMRRAPAASPPPVIVDLCCGSGAVGAAVVAGLGGGAALYAADVDPAAVRCARRNVAPVGGQVYEGDLFAPLPPALRGRVDVLTANVPYVPTGEVALLPAEAREHEPLVALDGGADGLDVLRRVAAAAPNWLAPGGCLLVETSERQAERAALAFVHSGLTARVVASEELAVTVVMGTLAPLGQHPWRRS